MSRILLLAFASALTITAPAWAQQRSGAAKASQWRSWVWACRIDRRATDPALPRPTGTAERNCFDPQLRGLARDEDIPVALRRTRFQGSSGLALDITPQGRVGACTIERSSGEPRLDRIACDIVSDRARFRPLYAGPGRPVAARHEIEIGWEVTNDPPLPMFSIVPPAPAQPGTVDFTRPRTWPRLTWHNLVTAASLPGIQSDYPAGTVRNGTVGLDLLVSAERGIESCFIGVSAGDAALDDAACRVARTLELRYPVPCEVCTTMLVPLQIVWRRGGGSHIRYPLPLGTHPTFGPAPPRDPADTRAAVAQRSFPVPIEFELSPSDFRRIPDRNMRLRPLVVSVAVDFEGRPTSCSTRRSTGNPAIDARTCELIMRRARYRPRTDVFGDPVATEPGFGQTVALPVLD